MPFSEQGERLSSRRLADDGRNSQDRQAAWDSSTEDKISMGFSDIWGGGGVDQGWVGTVLPKVLLVWIAAVASRRCRRRED